MRDIHMFSAGCCFITGLVLIRDGEFLMSIFSVFLCLVNAGFAFKHEHE